MSRNDSVLESDFETVLAVYKPWIEECERLREVAQSVLSSRLKHDETKEKSDLTKRAISQSIVNVFLESEPAFYFFSNISSFYWVNSDPAYFKMITAMWKAFWRLAEFKQNDSVKELAKAIDSLYQESLEINEPVMHLITIDSMTRVSPSIQLLASALCVPVITKTLFQNPKLAIDLKGNRQQFYNKISDYTETDPDLPSISPETLRKENDRYRLKSDESLDLLQQNYNMAKVSYKFRRDDDKK